MSSTSPLKTPLTTAEQHTLISLYMGTLIEEGVTPAWARDLLAKPRDEQVWILCYGMKPGQDRALKSAFFTGWRRLTLHDLIVAIACVDDWQAQEPSLDHHTV